MIEMTERKGWRRKQLLDELEKKRGYWKLEEEPWATLCIAFPLEEAIDLP
jgi:hypothetical protein